MRVRHAPLRPTGTTFSTRSRHRAGCGWCPDVLRQLAQQEFGADGGAAQLAVGEPEIIAALRHMIGEFVAEAEAQPARMPGIVDDVDAGDLRAPRRRRGRRPGRRGLAGADQDRPVALVEPFGLGTGLALRRLAAFDAHQEHAHRIRHRPGCRGAVHLVPALGRAEMRRGRCRSRSRWAGS